MKDLFASIGSAIVFIVALFFVWMFFGFLIDYGKELGRAEVYKKIYICEQYASGPVQCKKDPNYQWK